MSAHSLINLGRLVELQEALLASLQVVLHEQWNILSEAKLDGTAERSCLRRNHQVSHGKGCSDRLVDPILGLLGSRTIRPQASPSASGSYGVTAASVSAGANLLRMARAVSLCREHETR